MSLAACEERCANVRTSDATTAKPRPASPARAASTAALSANKLVCRAISSITPMMSEILPEDVFDLRHGLDRLGDHLAAAIGDVARLAGGLIGLLRVLGVLLHRGGDLLHRGRSLFQARGLLLGALRQVGRAGRDLRRGVGHLAASTTTIDLDGFAQLLDRRIEIVLDLPIGLGETRHPGDRQVALGHFAKPFGERLDGPRLLFGRDGLRLGVAPALLLGLLPLLLGFLALLGGSRFQAHFFLAGIAEHQHGLGHLADLVLALAAFDLDVEIAFRQGAHALAKPAQRLRYPRHRQP